MSKTNTRKDPVKEALEAYENNMATPEQIDILKIYAKGHAEELLEAYKNSAATPEQIDILKIYVGEHYDPDAERCKLTCRYRRECGEIHKIYGVRLRILDPTTLPPLWPSA